MNTPLTPGDSCSTVEDNFAQRNVKPAAQQPCQECPWRTSNRGRSHPDRLFAEDWLTTKWRGISQEGHTLTCHVFDGGAMPFNEEIKDAGFVRPVATGDRKECAGVVAMVRRELESIVTSPSFEAYQQSRP